MSTREFTVTVKQTGPGVIMLVAHWRDSGKLIATRRRKIVNEDCHELDFADAAAVFLDAHVGIMRRCRQLSMF